MSELWDDKEVLKDVEGLEKVDEVRLSDVSELAKRLVALFNETTKAEIEWKEKKDELRQVQEELLPQAMSSLGLSQLKLSTGERVTVTNFYGASINPEDREAMFNWLHDHGHGDIIKHNVSVDFKKGEGEYADEAMMKLKSIGLAPRDDIKIAPMTLKAFVREEVEAGRELPEEFNVYVGQRAAIKR